MAFENPFWAPRTSRRRATNDHKPYTYIDPFFVLPSMDDTRCVLPGKLLPCGVPLLPARKRTPAIWKRICEKLLHIAMDSKTCLDLCAKIDSALDQATDTIDDVLHWALEETHFLETQRSSDRAYGVWMAQQQWEHWHDEATSLSVDASLLPTFLKAVEDLCHSEARALQQDIKDLMTAATSLHHVATMQHVSFCTCVLSFPLPYSKTGTRPQPYLTTGLEQGLDRIKSKIELYDGHLVKDMNRARFYFEIAEAAVETLRAVHAAQSHPDETDKIPFVILEIKSNLLNPLRSILVVVGTWDTYGRHVVGEVQFIVSPTSDDAVTGRKLHFLNEIKRVICDGSNSTSSKSSCGSSGTSSSTICSGSIDFKHEVKEVHEMSSALKNEIRLGLSKLSFGEIQHTEQQISANGQAEAAFCQKLCKMITNVPIARTLFSEMNVWIQDIEKTLKLAAEPQDDGLEQLADALLDAQQVIVQASAHNLVQLFQSFTDEKSVSSFLKTVKEKTSSLITAHRALEIRAVERETVHDVSADLLVIERLQKFQEEVREQGPAKVNLNNYLLKPGDLVALNNSLLIENLIALQQLWAYEFHVSWERELAEFTASSEHKPVCMQDKIALLQSKTRALISSATELIEKLETNQLISSKQELPKFLKEAKEGLDRVLFQLVVVVGTLDSGKSTLINGIIGHRLLPVRAHATTMFPIKVKHDPEEKGAVLRIASDVLRPFRQSMRWVKSLAAAMGLGGPVHYEEGTADTDPEILRLMHRFRSLFKDKIAEHLEKKQEIVSSEEQSVQLIDSIFKDAEQKFEAAAKIIQGLDADGYAVRNMRKQLEDCKEAEQHFRVAEEWDHKVTLIKNNFGSFADQRVVADAIFKDTVCLDSIEEGVSGVEECRQALELLTFIARISVAFCLPNPASEMEERWPEVSVCFQNMDPNMLGEFCIVDTPGLDEALGANMNPELVDNLLMKASAVLCVLNANNLENKATKEIFKGTTDTLKDIRHKNPHSVFIVCNRLDELQDNIAPGDAKKYAANLFEVPEDDVFIASAEAACLSKDVIEYFRSHSEKPVVDFNKPMSDNRDPESIFRAWAKHFCGRYASQTYPALGEEKLQTDNMEFRKRSHVEELQESVYKLVASRVVFVAVLDIVRSIEQKLYMPVREKLNRRMNGVDDNITQLSENRRMLMEAQQKSKLSLMDIGVKTVQENGKYVLKTVHVGISFQANLITKLDQFASDLQEQLHAPLLHEFKADNYCAQVGEVYELHFPNFQLLSRRMRVISATMWSFITGQVNKFVPLLSRELSGSIRDLAMVLNAGLCSVDAGLAQAWLYPDAFVDLIFYSNPLTPSRLKAKAFLKEMQKRFASMSDTLTVTFSNLIEEFKKAITTLMESFATQILKNFARELESQRQGVFKLCARQFDIRDHQIAECERNLDKKLRSAQGVAELALLTFSKLDQPSQEVRFWAQRLSTRLV